MATAISAPAQFLPSPPPATPNGQPVNTPIDGGAIGLLAAGAAYGYKKMRAMKKQDVDL